jgi:hypothetical protein
LSGNAETRRHKSNLIAAYAPILPLDCESCDTLRGYNGIDLGFEEKRMIFFIVIGVAIRRGSIVMRLLV